MTSLSSTYLIPAILLNPIVILHGFNTFCSHFISTTIPVVASNRQWLVNLGPAAAPGPYLDVHDNNQLCWGYTALMVVVQVLAYGKVNDNRIRKKNARAAAKAERERKAAAKDQKAGLDQRTSAPANGHAWESDNFRDSAPSVHMKSTLKDHPLAAHDDYEGPGSKEGLQNTEDSSTETSSEEETIV